MNLQPPPPPPPGQLPGRIEDSCRAEIHLHSHGIWDENDDEGNPRGFFQYSLPLLLFQISIIFVLTQSLYLLIKRVRLPRIVAELLAGIILGPTVLGQIPSFTDTFFPPEGNRYLDLLSKIGFIFCIFLSGVKMDPMMILKCGRKAWTIALTGCILPLGFFYNIMSQFDNYSIHRYRKSAISSIFSIHFLYSFHVTASLLVDLKIINSELGRLGLASTLVADLLTNAIATYFSSLRASKSSNVAASWMNSFGLTISLILFLLLTIRPVSVWIIKRTPEGKPVDKSFIIFMVFLVLFAVVAADNAGISYQSGSFILGLMIPDGPPLGSTLVEKLDTIISGLFAPLFLSYCGLQVNLIELYDLKFVIVVWVTIAMSFMAKYCSILFTSLACHVPPKDAASLAFMMSTQGLVQMSHYFNGAINQTIDAETFSMLTSSVLIIAAVAHFFVGILHDYSNIYAGYRKRNIENSPATTELRILVCAHRPDEVLAEIMLLDASFPCKESPLLVYALHLVELVGQATPLLIDHQLGQKHSSRVSNARSQKILEMFQSFELQHAESATVLFFTAISMMKFMHHDICSLAFDKLTSFIILPFHRKWNQQGRMISDSAILRTINCNVLDLAPCSVGILIDRHKIRKQKSLSDEYHVGMIFIGGSDDREAVCFGKRMAKSPEVQFTVVRFVPQNPDMEENQWDAVLDAETLKGIRLLGQQQGNVGYREERVNDGAESALKIHAMEDAFDLILVGRRHKDDAPQLAGLTEWNDLPELGPIGDMLAAADIITPLSILVVQQQSKKNK